MIFFNSTGERSTFCGNGARCIIAFAKYLDIIIEETSFIAYDGIHKGSISKNNVSLKMSDINDINIQEDYIILDTGSPHLIRLYENIDSIDIVKEARELKLIYSEYTDGLNINFCEISDSKIKLRTYERGVEDETLSCGTGAVASAVFLKDYGLVSHDKIEILMKGGLLCVELNKEKNLFSDIWLSGEVNMVFKGVYNKFES